MPRKTEFASTWWAQRWIRVLERFGWSARLNRGRAYARHGNVLDLDVQAGLVRAKVQGSRKQPYRVEIGLKPIPRQDWERVFQLLKRKAIYAARLLSGEMPRDIEEIFAAAEVPLFPRSGEDLIMSCTCPDWASPRPRACPNAQNAARLDRAAGGAHQRLLGGGRGAGRHNDSCHSAPRPRL